MNPKNYVISILVISAFVGAVFMFRDQLFLSKNNKSLSDSSFGWKIPPSALQASGQVTDSGAYSSLRIAGGAPRGLPVRLKIPVIGVDTAIEDAYITPDGKMDVPAGSVNVAWYALGPRPGQIGSAVIGGHFGIDNGIPKVFYNLDKLKAGDKIYVVNDIGNNLVFSVRSIRVFGRNDDSSPVFLSSDGLAHLNVITCEGEWNRINDSYPDRRVVFTDALPTEDIIAVKPYVAVTPRLPATAEKLVILKPESTISLTLPPEKITIDTPIVASNEGVSQTHPVALFFFSLLIVSTLFAITSLVATIIRK